MATTRTQGRPVVFAVLAVAVLAFALLQSLVIPVLPTIRAALGTSQAGVTWVLTAYLLSASVSTPMAGRLGDMTGRKRMFLGVLSALALGCLVAALASSLAVMIVARVIQGIGGGILPLAFGIIRDEFPPGKVPGAVAVTASMMAAGTATGLVVAGPIVELLGYGWLFWLPFCLLVVAIVAAASVLPDSSTRAGGRVNWTAAVLLSCWLVTLLLPVSRGSAWGWESPIVVGLLASAVGCAVLWVVVELRSHHPLMDIRVLRLRAVWTTNVVGVLFGLSLLAAYALLPQFLQTAPAAGYGFGTSVTQSGWMLLPMTIAAFLVGLFCGRLGQRFGSKRVLIVGLVVATVGVLLFVPVNDQRWGIYAVSTFIGTGYGLVFGSMSNLIVAAVPPEQTGAATGMNANTQTIGGSIGSAITAGILTAEVGPGGVPELSAYTNGFLLLAGLLALTVPVASLIPAAHRVLVARQPGMVVGHPGAVVPAADPMTGS